MGNRTLSPEAEARAEEIFQSWRNAVTIFLAGHVGQEMLKDMPAHLCDPMRATLVAQIQAPDDADEQLIEALRDLRLKKRLEAKALLREALSARKKDEPLEREWMDLEANARGNVSSVKRVSSWSLKAVKPNESPSTAGPETLPAPPSEPEAPEPDSKSTIPAPPNPGRQTIPAEYSEQALSSWRQGKKVPSLKELLGAVSVEEVVDEKASVDLNPTSVQTYQAILPPPSDQEDAPQIEINEDQGEETLTSEMDLVFEQFLKDE